MTLFDAGEPAPASPAPEGASQPVIRLVVAYDGTEFHGFAAQPEQRTVTGVLVEAIEQALRRPVEQFTGAGRTDAGVHAWGQVVTFRVGSGPGQPVDPERLRQSVNRRLGPEVVVRSAALAPPGFDARRSACWRHYRYTIVNRPEPDPFLARYSWWVAEPLDLSTLRLGADPFVGEHDFAAFCRKGTAGSTTVRRVLASHWTDGGGGVLRYDIRASAFCWQMVRSIVGLLVEVGSGRRRPGDILAVIRSRDRANATRLAPPQGLCLRAVGYEDSTGPDGGSSSR
ncbi:MAG TPA: tRNA pseudouridine(38-40) synthase TruA [Acidimicrobiia bacterium]|nr:tRNA pseudouridine(38-40) synthase TruA [Acidimicrobiia bacterium]